MVFSPLMPALGGPALIYWPQHKGSRGGLARMNVVMRRLDAACRRNSGVARGVFYSNTHQIFFARGKSVRRSQTADPFVDRSSSRRQVMFTLHRLAKKWLLKPYPAT
jgi:hypothetical protein